MMTSGAKAGEAALVGRRLTRPYQPIDLFAALASHGAPMFIRRTGGWSLILVDAALRLEATKGDARIEALSEGGELLLDAIAARLADHLVDRSGRVATFRFIRSDDPDEEARAAGPSALDALRAMLAAVRPLDRDEPFALCAAGIIGFDHVDMLEDLPPRPDGDFPDVVFLLAETVVVNEPSRAARVLALAVGSDDAAVAHRQISLASERLARLVERCDQARPPALADAPTNLPVTTDQDDGEYAAVVERLKENIFAGDIFQVVPSRAFRTACDDPLAAFRRLVAADPSAYNFCVDTGRGTLFGASPETAVEIRRDDEGLTVAVSPIAGTRPRGKSGDEDDRHEADLRLDRKELAEHMMLVDLARNDVARVAARGTRRIASLLGVERFARVMHLVSSVEGRLAEGRDAIDVIRTCLNVGTLSGAPKLKAIELIRGVERSPRGPYGGAVGWLLGDGSMDTAVVIRSALVRAGIAEVRAGAGVVADSVPLAEAAETRIKASAVLAALGAVA